MLCVLSSIALQPVATATNRCPREDVNACMSHTALAVIGVWSNRARSVPSLVKRHKLAEPGQTAQGQYRAWSNGPRLRSLVKWSKVTESGQMAQGQYCNRSLVNRS